MIHMMSLQEAIDLLGSPPWTEDFQAYCESLKTNFRKLILKFHADKVSDDEGLEEMGRKIIEANSVIKDAIETGLLKRHLGANIKQKAHKVSEDAQTAKQWTDDLFSEVSSITEMLVKSLGSMKSLLDSLTPGTHTVYFKGLSFKVTTHKSKSAFREEMDKTWVIHNNTISSVIDLPEHSEPLQLIFG